MLKKEGKRVSKFYLLNNFKREKIIYQIRLNVFILAMRKLNAKEFE